MSQHIPIQNIYYLFCYAWDRFEESKVVDVGGVDSPELVDLLAKVLSSGLKRLIRMGIDRGYVVVKEDSTCLTWSCEYQPKYAAQVSKGT